MLGRYLFGHCQRLRCFKQELYRNIFQNLQLLNLPYRCQELTNIVSCQLTQSRTVNCMNPSLQATNAVNVKPLATSPVTPSFWTQSLPSGVLTVKQSTDPTARLTPWTMICTLVLPVPLGTSSKQSTHQTPWKKDV